MPARRRGSRALAKDVSEYLATLDAAGRRSRGGLTVAYHSACSLQHGQKVTPQPKDAAGPVRASWSKTLPKVICAAARPAPTISCSRSCAERLRDRKVANIERLKPDVIAAGNIGCMTQIASGTAIPVVHTVELIDWATGGPLPEQRADPGRSWRRRRGRKAAAAGKEAKKAKVVKKAKKVAAKKGRKKRRRRRPRRPRKRKRPRRPRPLPRPALSGTRSGCRRPAATRQASAATPRTCPADRMQTARNSQGPEPHRFWTGDPTSRLGRRSRASGPSFAM